MVLFSLHLETAFLASMLSGLVILLGMILIRFLAKDLKGTFFWIIAYICGVSEYGSLYLLNEQWQLFFEFLLDIYFGAFLIIGIKIFSDLKVSKKRWGVFLSVILIIDVLIVFIIKNFTVFIYIISLISGSILIYAAYIVFQLSKSVEYTEDRKVLLFIGITFLLDGLHMYDYPFLRPIAWFAPIGYMIGFCLTQAMAVGLFILVFQKINHLNMKSKAKITKLEGLLPICASCKKIRDVHGYWNQLEEYFQQNSEIMFSHGLCDDCVEKLYPDL
jgi:hypothetical protein